MPVIITNSEFQKNVGKISRSIGPKPYIVTNHGKALMVVLPYFEEGDGLIENYLEDYEMWQNRKKLQDKYRKSSKSGASDLTI